MHAMYDCMHACMHVCIYIYICIDIYPYTCMYVFIYKGMNIRKHTYLYIYIYIYIHIYDGPSSGHRQDSSPRPRTRRCARPGGCTGCTSRPPRDRLNGLAVVSPFMVCRLCDYRLRFSVEGLGYGFCSVLGYLGSWSRPRRPCHSSLPLPRR